jgi:hypothetical protein
MLQKRIRERQTRSFLHYKEKMELAEKKRQKEIESASFKLPNFRKSPRLAYDVAVRRKVVEFK